MNKHLQLVRDYQELFGIEQANATETVSLSDMDIVMYQALLMDYGSTTFKEITSGDLASILSALINLAYISLAPIAIRGDDVISTSVAWRQDGSVLSVVRLLSEKINHCSSGETIYYSALYNICEILVRGFINADFDKAFQMVHQNLILKSSNIEADQNYAARLIRASLPSTPDLSETLYE